MVEIQIIFFDRLKEPGLANCLDSYFDDFVQAHRPPKSEVPCQNNYFLISKKLEKNLTDCKALDNEKFSDHNPVVIKIE